MSFRKLTLIGLAFALLAPVALLAQPPEDVPGNPGRAPNHLRDLLPPPGYLQLTEEQQDIVRGLAEDLREVLEPLRDERRSLGQELRDALDADEPDPCLVGQLTIDLHDLGEQIRAELAATEEAFRAILDDEQQTKWDNFKELRRLTRRQHRGPGR